MAAPSNLCQLNENKICDNCDACKYCDLDKTKICDNCCVCLDNNGVPESDYAVIKISEILMDGLVDEIIIPIKDKPTKKSKSSS